LFSALMRRALEQRGHYVALAVDAKSGRESLKGQEFDALVCDILLPDETGLHILRDARNQALMTAAGVGGMQALGEMLKRPPHPQSVRHDVNVNVPQPPQLEAPPPQLDPEQKLAAHIMVDDVLEDGCNQLIDPGEKHAALVQLIRHRCEGTRLLRGFLP